MMQWIKRWLVYRPNIRGIHNLPLGVRSAGHYCVRPPWHEQSRPKPFLQLFWVVKGEGCFTLKRKKARVREEDLFLYHPGDCHNIKAISPDWTYCWVTFDHPDILRWVRGFGLTAHHQAVGPCPEPLFHQIAEALRNCTPEGEQQAAHLAHALLLRAAGPTPQTSSDPLATAAKSRFDRDFNQPSCDIASTADKLGVHRTTLFRRFQAYYGLNPSDYLQNLRIQRAMSLLRESNLPIQDVAWQAGFPDPNYLARTIRKATGLSPRAFRLS